MHWQYNNDERHFHCTRPNMFMYVYVHIPLKLTCVHVHMYLVFTCVLLDKSDFLHAFLHK